MPVIGCTLVIWLCRGISDSVLSDELEKPWLALLIDELSEALLTDDGIDAELLTSLEEAEDTTDVELLEELERSLAGELDEGPSEDEPPPQANNDKIHTVPINRVIVEYMLIPVIKSCSRLSYAQCFKFRLLLL
jgi:hypothetical protein